MNVIEDIAKALEIKVVELHELCGREYKTTGREEWRNQLALDLNWILGCAQWRLVTWGDELDVLYAQGALRIADRLEEQEELERK